MIGKHKYLLIEMHVQKKRCIYPMKRNILKEEKKPSERLESKCLGAVKTFSYTEITIMNYISY